MSDEPQAPPEPEPTVESVPAPAPRKSSIPTPVAIVIIVCGVLAAGWVYVRGKATEAHLGSWNATVDGKAIDLVFDRNGSGEIFYREGSGAGKFTWKASLNNVTCYPEPTVQMPFGQPGQPVTYAAKAEGTDTVMTCPQGTFTLKSPQAPGSGAPSGPTGPPR